MLMVVLILGYTMGMLTEGTDICIYIEREI